MATATRQEQAAGVRAAAEGKPLRPVDVLRFHLPVAATIFGYAMIFNVMNGAVARTSAAAATSLAAFGVAQSLVDLFAVPAAIGNQWVVARGRDRASLRRGLGVLAQIVAILTLLFAAMGWTPLGRWVACDVFGAPVHLYPSVNLALRICIGMPLVWAIRNASQGILMIRRRTHWMAMAVVIRFACILGASAALLRVPSLDGAALGALLWMIGMCIEATILGICAWVSARGLPATAAQGGVERSEGGAERSEDGSPPTRAGTDIAGVWRFVLPLIVTSLLWALARPLVNTAMARTATPEMSIAAYQVAWPAAFLLLAVQMEFRQTFAVLWTGKDSFRVIWRFGLCVGGGMSALMILLGLTGGASAMMRVALGAPPDLAEVAGRLFVIIGLVPMSWMLSEIYFGFLLRQGNTAAVGLAKGANMAVMIIVMFGLVAVAPSIGPAVGAIGLAAGHAAELVAVRLLLRRQAGVAF